MQTSKTGEISIGLDDYSNANIFIMGFHYNFANCFYCRKIGGGISEISVLFLHNILFIQREHFDYTILRAQQYFPFLLPHLSGSARPPSCLLEVCLLFITLVSPPGEQWFSYFPLVEFFRRWLNL